MSHAPTRRQAAFVAAALLLSPLLTLYATQAVWLQNLLTPFSWMASHLPASGLFWLLFFSLMLPLYGLTRRLFIAYLPGTGFCMTLAIISRYKMDINGAPLQLSDFTFVGNLGDIAGFASDMLAPTLTVVVSVIVCILWTVLLAVLEKRVGFKLAQKDVFLNIAGGIRVTDPAIDLSVIASVLSSNVDTAIERNVCMAGEVGLSGEIRPVTRIAQRIAEAEKLGFSRFILPDANLKGLEGAKRHIELVPVHRVEEALRALFG